MLDMFKVALLDDEEWILKGIECTFPWEEYGFCVAARFTEPEELIEFLKTDKVDVIFTDIKMLGMSGLELIEKIQADLEIYDVLYVIISAYDDYDLMRKAINLGVVDYCRKPIQREAAHKILQNLEKKLKNRKTNDSDSMAHIRLSEIISYINENMGRRLTLKDVAKHSGYNSNYICLLFRNNIGMSFSEYLLSVRMKKAKELFDTKKYSVKEVQMMVGYAEYSYFHSTFTKYFGITPAKYLKGEAKEE